MGSGGDNAVKVWFGSGAIIALATWAALWSTYGLWAALFGWLPGIILGAVGGLLIALYWRVIAGVAIVAAAGIAFLAWTAR